MASIIRRAWPGGVIVLAIGVALSLSHHHAAFGAQICVPFASIVAGSPAEYDTYEIKFTWIGEQSRRKATFGVAGSATVFSAVDFAPCRPTNTPAPKPASASSAARKIVMGFMGDCVSGILRGLILQIHVGFRFAPNRAPRL